MLIEDYFEQLQNFLEVSPIIQHKDISFQKRGDYIGFIRGNIYFRNNSVLHFREYIDIEMGLERGKYAYQYMNNSNNLVFRYDNAEHHQNLNLSNFPHHKHQSDEKNIISSHAPSLVEVLNEIERLLNLS